MSATPAHEKTAPAPAGDTHVTAGARAIGGAAVRGAGSAVEVAAAPPSLLGEAGGPQSPGVAGVLTLGALWARAAGERFASVAALHHRVDEVVARVSAEYASSLACRRGCTACCTDDLTVFPVEAARIRRGYASVLVSEAPAPRGVCAFLDASGACRVYAARPYVCRTHGLPLRWFEAIDDDDDVIREARDICVLNAAAVPVAAVPAEACWTLGPFEEALFEAQVATGSLRRLALRGMFAAARARRRAASAGRRKALGARSLARRSADDRGHR